MIILVILLFILYIIYKKCYIEPFDKKCDKCLNKCLRRHKSNTIPHCITECEGQRLLCNNKASKEYNKYYYIHVKYKHISYIDGKIQLSDKKQNFIPFKRKKRKKTYLQSKINCIRGGEGCDYYFGVKDDELNLYKKNDIRKKNRIWRVKRRGNKYLLKINRKYLKVNGNDLELTKKRNATKFDISLFK